MLIIIATSIQLKCWLRALMFSEDYSSGRAEAYNNLAFVCIAKMDYKGQGMAEES